MALSKGFRISIQLFVVKEELKMRFYLHKEAFLITVRELSNDTSSPVPR